MNGLNNSRKVKVDKFEHLLSLLKNKINFCFVRFNDGEMMGIGRVGAVVARGDQKVNKELHKKLIKAIKHEQKNYWIGKPCSVCFPKHYNLFNQYVRSDYEYLTHATVFCNAGHWDRFIKFFRKCSDRDIIWVSGKDQDLSMLPYKLNVVKHIKVPLKNCWSIYDSIKNETFKDDSLVILSCGPMSRILAYEWYVKNSNCTYLDLGSMFDPFTRNVWHKCHRGNLKFCKECNTI